MTTKGTNPLTDYPRTSARLPSGTAFWSRSSSKSSARARSMSAAAWYQAARINQGPWLHGMGVSRVAETHRQQTVQEKAIACLEWLIRNKSPLYADYS
jgi:hypothetical protein